MSNHFVRQNIVSASGQGKHAGTSARAESAKIQNLGKWRQWPTIKGASVENQGVLKNTVNVSRMEGNVDRTANVSAATMGND